MEHHHHRAARARAASPPPAHSPAMRYRCRKCAAVDFRSVGELTEHQRRCKGGAGGAAGGTGAALCRSCGVYLEGWRFYSHMRDAHSRHICLLCFSQFSRSERLAAHLRAKHARPERRFDAPERLAAALPAEFHLTCCRCEAPFGAGDAYAEHECAPPPPPSEREAHFAPFGLAEEDGIAIPETKPEKMSRTALEQLIMEVKNCVAGAPKPPQPPALRSPPPPPPPMAGAPQEEEAPVAPRANGPAPVDPPSDCRVPKLTVKIPRPPPPSSSSSDSEDDNKLTVDLGENDGVKEEAEAQEVKTVEKSEPQEVKTEEREVEGDLAGDDVPTIELTLDRPLDRHEPTDLLRALLAASIYSCIYCNHARKIAVDAKQLGLHFIAQHKFTATVDSITAEELTNETIVAKLRAQLDEAEGAFVNLAKPQDGSDAKRFERTYECFQCYYATTAHKDLYFHNRKMHQKNILLCTMCKTNFYTYSELLCHLCPGTYVKGEINFECCLCHATKIPSAFRLMIHLRKKHLACDVCLEICPDQSKLSVHVWKHKLHHLCYRCGIAYRNKPDITKHLFWKHGTESVPCKKCLQKKWPHVYHLCVPPSSFACDECALTFSKAVYLKVHKRLHSGDFIHGCEEQGCEEKFISKKLLEKHRKRHSEPTNAIEAENDGNKSDPDVEIVKEIKPSEEIVVIDDDPKPEADAPVVSSKSKRRKRQEKENLLMDVNLPELNLSESGSSDESEAEASKPKSDPVSGTENLINLADEAKADGEEPKNDGVDDNKPEPITGIWDNFNLYQQSLEKPPDAPLLPPKHVCDSDHDYCVIPSAEPDVQIVGESKPKMNNSAKDSPKKRRSSKKNKNKNDSSSSDSSSDSDSSCSKSNCSCCSSSGSSSSSSSSDSSSSVLGRPKKKKLRKTSEASHTSAVDIMETEDPPLPLEPPPKPEPSIPESDLETDESETDEEFYDEHPERIASKLLEEKRNLLMQQASSPINNNLNNGALTEPEPSAKREETVIKKKVKLKKRRKEKKSESLHIEVDDGPVLLPEKPSVPIRAKANRQRPPKVHKISRSPSMDYGKTPTGNASDDSKRASKRRRVPNKFYGYSSDEESGGGGGHHAMASQKPHLPPKLEWRKEDLPSPVREVASTPQPPPPLPSPMVVPPLKIAAVPREPIYSSDDSDSSREGVLQIVQTPTRHQNNNAPMGAAPPQLTYNRFEPLGHDAIPFPRPVGAREAREGESVYCYCRCPYDEVSEMIACDAAGCAIEWFHFECVGIMVPPKGKWYCPDCRLRRQMD